MIIASNNVWNNDYNTAEWASRGEDCSPEVRVKGLLKAYKKIMPDILGFQEMSCKMQNLLMNEMSDFELLDGSHATYSIINGGFTPLVYRSDKLNLLEYGNDCFSETIPELEGTFNDGHSKGYSFGVFEEEVLPDGINEVKGAYPTPFGVISIEHKRVGGKIVSKINAPKEVEIIR